MRVWVALILLLCVMSGSLVYGQDDPIVTGEILYPEVNVRLGPSIGYQSLGILPQGTVINLHGWETYMDDRGPYFERNVWLYMTEPVSGLTGWIRTDMLYISDAQWLETLPSLDYEESGEIIIDQFIEENHFFLPEETTVYKNQVYGEVLTILPPNTPVTVLGWRMSYPSIYIQAGDVVGWVSPSDLNHRRFVNRQLAYFDALPQIIEFIPVYGQVTALGYWSGRQIYTLPDRQSDSHFLEDSLAIGVHGATSYDSSAWLYVTDVKTGVSGWVRPARLSFPYGFTLNMLPILEPVENPTILPARTTVYSLPATTRTIVTLERPVRIRNFSLAEIPAGTQLTLLGRSSWEDKFWTEYNGQQGWVQFQGLNIEGDFSLLPIVY